MTFHVPEQYRTLDSRLLRYGTSGNNGVFWVPYKHRFKRIVTQLAVIASDTKNWEHVSVSLPNRVPIYAHMRYVKNLFWDENDIVMELHVPLANHINIHPYCLHLWRPTNQTIPLPPMELV